MKDRPSHDTLQQRIVDLESALNASRREVASLQEQLREPNPRGGDDSRLAFTEKGLLSCRHFSDNLLASMQEGLSVLDPTGVHLLVNQALCNMTGYTREELIGVSPPHPYWAEEDMTAIMAALERTLDGQFGNYRMTFKKKNGTRFPVIVSPSAIQDDDGRILYYFALVKNISDLVAVKNHASRTARESGERFRLAFENANIGMCLVDLQGNLTKVNPQMTAIFGHSRDELESMTVNDITHLEDRGISPTFIQKAASGEVEYARFEKRFYHKDGHIVYCEVASSLIRDRHGSPQHFISHVQDITSRKIMERQLLQAQREWEEIFRAIGHPTLILDPAHRILKANRAAVTSTGKSLAEIEGRYCYEIFHGTRNPPADCPLSKLVQSGVNKESEMEVKALDGTFLVSCTPVFSDNGELEKVIHVATDISRLKEAENRLIHRKQLLETISLLQTGVIKNVAPAHIFKIMLDDLVRLTGSEFGFMGEALVDSQGRPYLKTHALTDIAWNKKAQALYRKHVVGGLEFRNLDTLFGHALKSRRPVISNDPATDSRRGKLPEGHPPLRSFLAIPLLTEKNVVGLIGIANRAGGYDQTLIDFLKPLVTTCSTAIEFSRDRLKQIKTERELLLSEALFRGVFEHSSSGKSLILPDGRLSNVNQQFCNLLGYDAETLTQKTFVDITHPDDVAESRDLIRDLLAGKENAGTIEKRYIRANGDIVWTDVHTTLLRDETGRPAHFVTDIIDITDKRQTAEALKQREKMLRNILDNIPMMIAFLDKAGNIQWVNARWEETLGYSRDEIQSMDVWARLYPDPKYRKTVSEFILKAEDKWGDFRIHARDGRIIETVWANVILDDGTNIGIGEDVTEKNRTERKKKELEAQLIQAQKLESVGRLAGGVAHDFNNMLSVILGYGEILCENLPEDHPHYELAKEIFDAGIRAKHMTRQLLAFSRKQVFEIRTIDLNDAVKGFEKMMRRMLREDILLDFRHDDEAIMIDADIAQLEQVLMNLVVNARDAMPDGGQILIATALAELDETYCASREGVNPGGYAMLAVTDTGAGMDPETRDRIFEPFFTTKDVSKGTGLGLSTVYGIVKQHGGNVWVYSEAGRGTTFRIYLPLSPVDVKPQPARPQAAPSTPRTATILVVEDDPAVRKLAVTILRNHGYQVLVAEGGQHALTAARNHPGIIDLLLTDVIMPKMKGPAVFEQIAQTHPETKVLYMSGYPGRTIGRHGVRIEGAAFVNKPLTVKTLLNKVAMVLQGAT